MLSQSSSKFWLILILIVSLAAVPRLLSYDYSLPYIDHPNEPPKYLAGLEWRGLIDLGTYYDGYPPGYIAVSFITQVIAAPLGVEGPVETIRVLRLISVVANLATLVLLALIARIAAGDLAGWLAGAAWGVSPAVLGISLHATQDPFVPFWVSLALWLAAVAATEEKRQHWVIWSVVAGILAIVFKYTVLSAILPGGIVALIYFARKPRRNFRYIAIQAGLVIPTAVWVALQAQALSQWQRHASQAMTSGLRDFLTPSHVINNIYNAILPLNPTAFLIILGLGMLAFGLAWARKLARVRGEIVALCIVLLITIPWLISTFSAQIDQRLRDALPATGAACILLGVAIVQVVHVVPKPLAKVAQVAIPLAAILPIFIPQAVEGWQFVQERQRPDRRVALWEWADITLAPGPYVGTGENHKTFNRAWGGYTGQNDFPFVEQAFIDERPIDEWRERGAQYGIIPYWYYEQMQETPEGQAYLNQMTLLKTYPPSEAYRGPDVAVFRLYPITHTTDGSLGPIHLVGYDMDRLEVTPGESISFRYYWQASQACDQEYVVFNHLVPMDSFDLVAQIDGTPLPDLRRPMTAWDDPTETLVSRLFEMVIGHDVSPGTYRLIMGFYHRETGQRLLGPDGDSYLVVTTITVSE